MYAASGGLLLKSPGASNMCTEAKTKTSPRNLWRVKSTSYLNLAKRVINMRTTNTISAIIPKLMARSLRGSKNCAMAETEKRRKPKERIRGWEVRRMKEI